MRKNHVCSGKKGGQIDSGMFFGSVTEGDSWCFELIVVILLRMLKSLISFQFEKIICRFGPICV